MIETAATDEYTTKRTRRAPDEFKHIKFKIEGSVARLTLNRPEHNLLNESMLRELADGVGFAGDRDEVKLIVLDSACKVFCGGIDVGEYTSQRVFQMLDAFHAAFAGMLETAKPVICVVNGPAIGGGAELAAFGDFVIATPKARFAQPEISIGVFPPLASTILPFLVGPKVALELVLTGEPVTAERALELGTGEQAGAGGSTAASGVGFDSSNHQPFGSGIDDGQASNSWRHGHVAERRTQAFHEYFSE